MLLTASYISHNNTFTVHFILTTCSWSCSLAQLVVNHKSFWMQHIPSHIYTGYPLTLLHLFLFSKKKTHYEEKQHFIGSLVSSLGICGSEIMQRKCKKCTVLFLHAIVQWLFRNRKYQIIADILVATLSKVPRSKTLWDSGEIKKRLLEKNSTLSTFSRRLQFGRFGCKPQLS